MWWVVLVELALNIILLSAKFITPLPSTLCIWFSMLACWTISFCKFTSNLVVTNTYFFNSKDPEKLWSLYLCTSYNLSLWLVDIFTLYDFTPHIPDGKSIWYDFYAIWTKIGTTITWKNWSHRMFFFQQKLPVCRITNHRYIKVCSSASHFKAHCCCIYIIVM